VLRKTLPAVWRLWSWSGPAGGGHVPSLGVRCLAGQVQLVVRMSLLGVRCAEFGRSGPASGAHVASFGCSAGFALVRSSSWCACPLLRCAVLWIRRVRSSWWCACRLLRVCCRGSVGSGPARGAHEAPPSLMRTSACVPGVFQGLAYTVGAFGGLVASGEAADGPTFPRQMPVLVRISPYVYRPKLGYDR
jgi:hypothetical protein